MIRNESTGASGFTMPKNISLEQFLALDEKHRPAIEAAVKKRDYAKAKRLHDVMQRELEALDAGDPGG